MRECRRTPLPAQPPKSQESRPPLRPVQHPQQTANCGTFANIHHPRQCRRHLNRPPPQIEPPAQRIDRRARLPLPRHPLGIARREQQRLHELRLAERASQEMRRPRIVEPRDGIHIAARHQCQHRPAIRHHRTAQRRRRRQPLGQCPARIHHRNCRAARQEPTLGAFRPPRRDDLPARFGRQRRQFVALPERQDIQRGRIAFGHVFPVRMLRDLTVRRLQNKNKRSTRLPCWNPRIADSPCSACVKGLALLT